MKKVKIAQIGMCHEHAEGKFRTLQALSDIYEIVGVVDDRDFECEKYYNANNCFDNVPTITLDELFSNPEIEAVTIEVSNSLLVPIALRCMEHNLPMHMDKPGGEDSVLFQKLLDGCRERNLPFQMGYMFRTNPAMLFCQRIIKEGWLGDIFTIDFDMNHNYGREDYEPYLESFAGGIMYNLGCHLVDQIVFMLGEPEKVTPVLKSSPNVQAKNSTIAMLHYPYTTVILRASSKVFDGLNRRTLSIVGSKGRVVLSPIERFDGKELTMELTLSEAREDYKEGLNIVNFGITEGRYNRQLTELAEIINGEKENYNLYEHDAIVEKTVLAVSGLI